MQKHDAFAALRYRDFSIVTINQFCLTLAILIQEIIVAYSLYQITKDPLTLGLIGLAEAIPFIALSLWGGYFADKFNKQVIMKICLFFLSTSSFSFMVTVPSAWVGSYQCKFPFLGYLCGYFWFGHHTWFYNPSATSLKPF